MSDTPVAAGKSSFDHIDSDTFFTLLDLKPGAAVLDLACGVGKYATELAALVGGRGKVYAVDLWREGLEHLDAEARRRGLVQLETLRADIREPLPLADASLDCCLLATILHDLAYDDQQRVIHEAARLLRPGGTLAIVEFKKLDYGPGPDIEIRLDPQQLAAQVEPCGFGHVAEQELGRYTYSALYAPAP